MSTGLVALPIVVVVLVVLALAASASRRVRARRLERRRDETSALRHSAHQRMQLAERRRAAARKETAGAQEGRPDR